jgi:hypothetical protein
MYTPYKYYAQVDTDTNKVLAVINIQTPYPNNQVPILSGVSFLSIGQSYINYELGLSGTWIQCKGPVMSGGLVDSRLPSNVPSIGMTYVPAKNKFVSPKPYDNWVWNEEKYAFVPPVPEPTDMSRFKQYMWNQAMGIWQIIQEGSKY